MKNRLIKIIAQFFNIPEEAVASASMKTVRDWNSLRHIELMMTLEEELEIERIIPEEMVFMASTENIKQILKNRGLIFE